MQIESYRAGKKELFMKKNRFFVFSLALIFALVLAGCKDNPKALAKETYDLTQDVMSNPLKMVGGMVKLANIKKKVDKLSPADKQIYSEELARLTGQETGGGLGILGALSGVDNAALKEALNAIMGAIGSLNISEAVPAAPPVEETATSVSSSITADSKSDDSAWIAIEDSELGRSAVTGIAFGRDKFVAVSNDGNLSYSTDGLKWTPVTDSPFDTTRISAIAFGNNKFVAVGNDGKIAYSSDGIKWTAVKDSPFGETTIDAITFGSGKFVAGGGVTDIVIAYSSDGVKWTAVTDFQSDGFYLLSAIAFGKGKFVVGARSGAMAYSTDGVKWTFVSDSTFGNSAITGIAFGRDKFVAGGENSNMAYSTDGVKWTAVTEFPDNNFYLLTAIGYGNGKFIAGGLGNGAFSAYSPDGISWTDLENPFKNSTVSAIVFGKGKLIAGGASSEMAYLKGK
jgi:hypothetical protein